MTDTIYALATAAGRAAVAIVRVSGPDSKAVLTRLTGRVAPKPRYASLRKLYAADGSLLDEALVLFFEGPSSFTGQDAAELQLHGGRSVVTGVLEALAAYGLRAAAPGEFTRRAFEHGRLTLAEAEGIADLVDAETKAQRSQALGQMAGALDQRFARWRVALISSLALLEAAIDFPDEDLPPDVASGAIAVLCELRADLRAAIDDQRGRQVRDGLRVALIGPPNVGKSSLFNALIGRDAAIVTSVPGTTRDVIEASLVLNGYQIILADTAGVRETADSIEAEGVRRAGQWAQSADLRLLVTDGSIASPSVLLDTPQPTESEWRVVSKVDLVPEALLPQTQVDSPFFVSAASGVGVDDLIAAIGAFAEKKLGGSVFPAATRMRHRALLSVAVEHLDAAIEQFGSSPELVGEDVRLACRALEQLSGRVDAEAVLDRVFASFCIGK